MHDLFAHPSYKRKFIAFFQGLGVGLMMVTEPRLRRVFKMWENVEIIIIIIIMSATETDSGK